MLYKCAACTLVHSDSQYDAVALNGLGRRRRRAKRRAGCCSVLVMTCSIRVLVLRLTCASRNSAHRTNQATLSPPVMMMMIAIVIIIVKNTVNGAVIAALPLIQFTRFV